MGHGNHLKVLSDYILLIGKDTVTLFKRDFSDGPLGVTLASPESVVKASAGIQWVPSPL
ncbi:MAG: hypothetical protein WCA08_18935 [Desulfoferrobacter sp.]